VERNARLKTMRAAKQRAEMHAIKSQAVPVSKDLDLGSFVSRQDLHVRDQRAKLAEKRASKQKMELGSQNFVPMINTRSRDMMSKKDESVFSSNRLLKTTASYERKRYKGKGDCETVVFRGLSKVPVPPAWESSVPYHELGHNKGRGMSSGSTRTGSGSPGRTGSTAR
jgi:hypothetical protein